MTEKSIFFRLGGKKHSMTLAEFGVALGLYTEEAMEDEYFEEYFKGGVRNEVKITNEALNEFWARVSSEDSLILSKSKVSTIKRNVLKVLHKMIVYLLCQRTTGFDKIQRMECWLLSLFERKNMGEYANVAWVVAHWLKKKGKGSQSDSELVCGHLITRLAKGLNTTRKQIL